MYAQPIAVTVTPQPGYPAPAPPGMVYAQAPVQAMPSAVPMGVPSGNHGKVVYELKCLEITCSPTKDLLDLFGFAHTVRIIAIIQLVFLCISIVGILFLCIPYAGMGFTEFRKKDYKCVMICRSMILIL